MSRTLRIAYARVAQESNALSPVHSTVEDFRSFHFLEGDELAAACRRRGVEAKSFMRNAELSGFVRAARDAGNVEPVPLFSAWAIPGGPLNRPTFDYFRDRLVEGLEKAGPVDGLFLSLHGAMNVEGMLDPEARLAEAARTVIGDKPIGASFDLHGQLTDDKVEAIDVFAAYRTNPHRDHAKIGRKAGDLLIRTLRGEIRPTSAWRTLPMLLGGGPTVDFMKPMRQVYAEMDRMERHDKVLSTNLFMCHLWNNHPDLGWSTHVTTDGDQALAEALADEIAELAWSVRHEMPPTFLSPSEAIERVRQANVRRKLGTVCICDASDVVTAGATGENTRLLKAFLDEGQGLVTYVPLRDPVAVEQIWGMPIGAEVELQVGGRLDPARNDGLTIKGRIRATHEQQITGRVVAVDVGTITVILTEGAAAAVKPIFFTDVGLSVWKADVVVVKTLFPFRIFFLPYSRMSLYVKTDGITDFDAAYQLDFTDPIHPRDTVHEWRPTDLRRRTDQAANRG